MAQSEGRLLGHDRDGRQVTRVDPGGLRVRLGVIARQNQPLCFDDDGAPGIEIVWNDSRGHDIVACNLNMPVARAALHLDTMVNEVLSEQVQIFDRQVHRANPVDHSRLCFRRLGHFEPAAYVHIVGIASKVQPAGLGNGFGRGVIAKGCNTAIDIPDTILPGDRHLPGKHVASHAGCVDALGVPG